MPCKETRCVAPAVLSVLGVCIIIVSFVIPGVLFRYVSNEFYRAATINTPETNDGSFNRFISNTYSGAASTYYSYYFWNTTNIDAVALNHSVPVLVEVGPYTYQEHYQYYYIDPVSQETTFGVYFNTDISTATFASVANQQFRTGNHPIYGYPLSCQGCNDQTDRIITASLLYATVFFKSSGNPGNEFYVRNTWVGQALPNILMTLNATLYSQTGYILLSSLTSLYTHMLLSPQFNQPLYVGNTFELLQYMSASSNPNVIDPYHVLSNSPNLAFYTHSFEFYNVANAGLLDAILVSKLQLPTYTSSPQLYALSASAITALYRTPLICPTPSTGNCSTCANMDFSLSASTGSSCWLSTTVNAAWTALHAHNVTLTTQQVGGIWAWLYYQSVYMQNMVFELEGHLGYRYVSVTRNNSAITVPYPTALTTNGSTTTYFNNANMYCSKSPSQLLFQNFSLLGAIIFPTKPYHQELGLIASSQRSLAVDSLAPHTLVTINTGQVNIAQVDEITAFSSGQPFTVTPPTFQTIYGSITLGNTSANAGASVQFCNPFSVGNTTNANYNIFQQFFNYPLGTRWTPTFPPGTQSSTFGFNSSIISPNLNFNMFDTVTQRQTNLTFWESTQVQNINAYSFTLSQGSYAVDTPGGLGYGVGSFALGSLICGGQPLLTSPPRFQLINTTDAIDFYNPLFAGTGNTLQGTPFAFDFPQLTFLSEAALAANNPNLDPENLLTFEELEPQSGVLLRGSHKQQFSVMVFAYAGAVASPNKATDLFTNAWFSTHNGYEAFMGPFRTYFWPIVWYDKHGELTSNQANTLKFAQGALTAAPLVLIIGTVLGFLQALISVFFLARYYRNRSNPRIVLIKEDYYLHQCPSDLAQANNSSINLVSRELSRE